MQDVSARRASINYTAEKNVRYNIYNIKHNVECV